MAQTVEQQTIELVAATLAAAKVQVNNRNGGVTDEILIRQYKEMLKALRESNI